LVLVWNPIQRIRGLSLHTRPRSLISSQLIWTAMTLDRLPQWQIAPKLRQVPRILLHPPHYMLRLPESSTYPSMVIFDSEATHQHRIGLYNGSHCSCCRCCAVRETNLGGALDKMKRWIMRIDKAYRVVLTAAFVASALVPRQTCASTLATIDFTYSGLDTTGIGGDSFGSGDFSLAVGSSPNIGVGSLFSCNSSVGPIYWAIVRQSADGCDDRQSRQRGRPKH
jgi:hypothetical protein